MDAHIAMALLHKGDATAPSAAAKGDPFADVPLAAAVTAAAAAGSFATLPSAISSASEVAAAADSEARQEAAALAAAAFAQVAASPDLESPSAQQPEPEMQNNAMGFASDAALAVSAAAAVTAMAAAADAAAAAADGQPAAMVARWEGACSSPAALERRLLVADYAATAPPPPLAGLASPFDACWCTLLTHPVPHIYTLASGMSLFLFRFHFMLKFSERKVQEFL